ncbi:hypothetical protein [Sphingobacterium rhinopitheci]|uniref:hypothetical protein n=1 Tax=Sphingobacterium rhinopitheci TaxID=2781960 RepID=UPI001F5245F4|nr:hypothetical protein [Sphingobacterium rhinopitheci]MCI0922402.1 hypothetical protein [Sphingobacterium rhinopitheci]
MHIEFIVDTGILYPLPSFIFEIVEDDRLQAYAYLLRLIGSPLILNGEKNLCFI